MLYNVGMRVGREDSTMCVYIRVGREGGQLWWSCWIGIQIIQNPVKRESREGYFTDAITLLLKDSKYLH